MNQFIRCATAAIVVSAAPLYGQDSRPAAPDSAAVDAAVRIARELAGRDSLWQLQENVVVLIGAGDSPTPRRDAAIAARHLGSKVRSATGVDAETHCPVGADARIRSECELGSGVQVLSISLPCCGKSLLSTLITLSRQGAAVSRGRGLSPDQRNGRTWRVVLEPDGSGGYRLLGNPGLLIP